MLVTGRAKLGVSRISSANCVQLAVWQRPQHPMSSVVPLPAGAPGRMHEALRVLVENDRVAVQPANAAGSGGSADTLGISLRSGAISCGPAPALGSSADAVLALLGVFTLKAGVVLAFVTGAEQVQQCSRRPWGGVGWGGGSAERLGDSGSC